MIDKISKEKCTGCKMCADICPKQAITFECDHHGFWYPSVNEEKCIKCEICIHKCPSLNFIGAAENFMPTVYSAWSRNEAIRISSTSGGAFWEIAEAFLEDGGIVAGCRYTKDWKSAEHILAHNVEELQQIKGSKYFQSDTAGIYQAVKKELDEGHKILFCGTPCQNAALRVFLGKEYEKLFCMDFICRSINSPKAFAAYITELEETYGAKAVNVHLKDKTYGWQSLATHVKFANGKEIIKDKTQDYWVKGFIGNDLYTRESCYHCQYKVLPRNSADLSIGDFWGITNQVKENMFKGISVVLVNSYKGAQLFERCKDRFVIQEHQLTEVLPANPALQKNPVRTEKQDMFFELLEKHPFSECVKKCTKIKKTVKLRRKMKASLRKAKKFGRLMLDRRVSKTKYFYYNYFCRNIVRDKNVKVIPYKGAILDLHPSARIYLSGKNLRIGHNMLKGSKSETHVRMNKNAVWKCKNGADLFYNTVLQVKEDAVFETGFFSANGGSVIIVDKKVTFGEDVMLGRNIIIYDSDFHSLLNENGIAANKPKPIVIEDHVWLTTDVVVLKGVTIGAGSLVTAQTVVNKDMPPHSIIAGKSNGSVIRDTVSWSRDLCPRN